MAEGELEDVAVLSETGAEVGHRLARRGEQSQQEQQRDAEWSHAKVLEAKVLEAKVFHKVLKQLRCRHLASGL